MVAQRSFVSPDSTLIAKIQHSSLTVSTFSGEAFRRFPLPQEFVAKCQILRWFNRDESLKAVTEKVGVLIEQWPCSRILLADENTVRIYDVNDSAWSATIERAASNLGSIADVAFGHNQNDIVVISDFGVKLTLWSLVTNRGVEIRDPKYAVHYYSLRPQTGHLAIVTRPAAQDVLMILGPGNHELLISVELPTVDAQEISWSPDGCWLAIRDVASGGHKAFIYTADGHLFKTFWGAMNDANIGLGLKRMKWNHSNGCLVLGDYNGNVEILSKNTVNLL